MADPLFGRGGRYFKGMVGFGDRSDDLAPIAVTWPGAAKTKSGEGLFRFPPAPEVVLPPEELARLEVARVERQKRQAAAHKIELARRCTLLATAVRFADLAPVAVTRAILPGSVGSVGWRHDTKFLLSEFIHHSSWLRLNYTHHMSYVDAVEGLVLNWNERLHGAFEAHLTALSNKAESPEELKARLDRETETLAVATEKLRQERETERIMAEARRRVEEERKFNADMAELELLIDPTRGTW